MNKRRRQERFWVALVLVAVVFFGFLEGWFFQLQSNLPLFGNISLFVLINLNVILLLLLAYLVLRNIVKLVFERKRNILGHKLRTRLVIAFVGLTLIPTVPLFWLATQFIFSSLDYWFTVQVEQSLEQSVNLAKEYLDQEGSNLDADCTKLESELRTLPHQQIHSTGTTSQVRAAMLEKYNMDAILLLDTAGNLVWHVQKPGQPYVKVKRLRNFLKEDPATSPKVRKITLGKGDSRREGLVSMVPYPSQPLPSQTDPTGTLFVCRLLPRHITEKLAAIASGYEDYLQLKLLHNPLKISHFITFSIVTLLVIFAAIWFGFFLAKNLTVPIQALVSATQRIAEGDLDVQLDSERTDEIGMLITSFNKMVRDLRENREKLASAYAALQQNHEELEDRRRYMEIVLKNIGAGVVSIDATGRVMTMNKSAETNFGPFGGDVRGRHYSDLLQPSHMDIVRSFSESYRMNRQPHLEDQVRIMIGNRPMVLLIKVSILRDERDQYMGVVVVLDDLTDLEKAQRMAAWREVARRIAHEIKNPLTPIKLCAQRLRRKYADLMQTEGSILDECTTTIVQQVDHMKHLVNEFSKFARLPRVQLIPCDLAAIVDESLSLYRHTYSNVAFSLRKIDDLPPLKLDRDQFKQVMLNLLDNALHALNGEPGAIDISLFHDPVLQIARLECSDTGHGLSAEDKLRMFEPYYSTKEKGTGLGLAIVSSIIADHNGFVRVGDNSPRGTVIIIELPG
jgi:two-component system, NtrC family, nitrogen regulation sensor histidine kinase NtrY